MDQDASTVVTPAPQANPKPKSADYLAILILVVYGFAEFADMLPSKYQGLVVALAVILRVYSKWLGSKQDTDAMQDGTAMGRELRDAADIMKAKRATPLDR